MGKLGQSVIVGACSRIHERAFAVGYSSRTAHQATRATQTGEEFDRRICASLSAGCPQWWVPQRTFCRRLPRSPAPR